MAQSSKRGYCCTGFQHTRHYPFSMLLWYKVHWLPLAMSSADVHHIQHHIPPCLPYTILLKFTMYQLVGTGSGWGHVRGLDHAKLRAQSVLLVAASLIACIWSWARLLDSASLFSSMVPETSNLWKHPERDDQEGRSTRTVEFLCI